jgi:MFS family permease
MRELFKLRNYRIYFVGSTVDSIGDMAFWLAAAIWVKELTGSTAASGLCFFFMTGAMVLSPLAGILVDRLPRKRLLMATNATLALLILSLVTVDRADQVWLIYTVMFFYGLSNSILVGAFAGLKERLMPKELFGDASGISQAVNQGMRLFTPAIGLSVLAAFGGHALAVMDAASFGFGLVCWSLIKIDDSKPVRSGNRGNWRAETTAGFHYLFATPVLRQLTLALSVGVFAIGFYETLGIAIVTVGLHHSPTYVGVMVTAMGVTGLLGGLLSGGLMKRIGAGMLTVAGLAAMVIGMPFFAIPNNFAVIFAACMLGLGLGPVIVGSGTALQLYTPNELMGRVSGADNLIGAGMQAIGIGVGAWLVSVVYYRDLVYLTVAILAVVTVFLATRPAQRKVNLPRVDATEMREDLEDEDLENTRGVRVGHTADRVSNPDASSAGTGV